MGFLIDLIPIMGATQMYTHLKSLQFNVYCVITNDGVMALEFYQDTLMVG